MTQPSHNNCLKQNFEKLYLCKKKEKKGMIFTSYKFIAYFILGWPESSAQFFHAIMEKSENLNINFLANPIYSIYNLSDDGMTYYSNKGFKKMLDNSIYWANKSQSWSNYVTQGSQI